MSNMSDHNRFMLNRVSMLNDLRSMREALENISKHGIKTDTEERLARICCTIIVSDMYFEDDVKEKGINIVSFLN